MRGSALSEANQHKHTTMSAVLHFTRSSIRESERERSGGKAEINNSKGEQIVSQRDEKGEEKHCKRLSDERSERTERSEMDRDGISRGKSEGSLRLWGASFDHQSLAANFLAGFMKSFRGLLFLTFLLKL